MINLYNIHDFAQIRVLGDGPIAHKLGEHLITFNSSRSCPEVIHINIDDDIKGYETTASIGNDRKLSFSNKKGLFFIKKDNELIAIDELNSSKNNKRIIVTSNFDISILMLFVEFFLRQYGVEKKIALLHGAAAEKNNMGLVFFGWQGSGKTAAVMSCVNQGFKFMSEDKIWISPDKILAYPRYIRINSSNIHLFLPKLTIVQQLRYHVGLILEARSSSKLMPAIIKSLVRKGLIIPSIKFNLQDLATSAEFSKEANIFKLYYLERGVSRLEDRDCSQELEKISHHIADYEWNHRLRDFYCAHDSLFLDRDSWVDILEDLIAKEKKLFRNIFNVNDVSKVSTSFKQVFIDVDELI